jgi:heme exporter protein D
MEHAGFIFAAYAVTGLVVLALILRAVLDHRAQRRALSDLERRGAGRRSRHG